MRIYMPYLAPTHTTRLNATRARADTHVYLLTTSRDALRPRIAIAPLHEMLTRWQSADNGDPRARGPEKSARARARRPAAAYLAVSSSLMALLLPWHPLRQHSPSRRKQRTTSMNSF